MLRQFLIIIGLALSFQATSIVCMDDNNSKEKKDKEKARTISQLYNDNQQELYFAKKRKIEKDTNESLESVQLIPDICKIIGEYAGYRLYNQLNNVHNLQNFNYENRNNSNCIYRNIGALIYCQEHKWLISGSSNEILKIFDLDHKSNMYLKYILTMPFAYMIHRLEYCQEIKCLIIHGHNNIFINDFDKNSPTYNKNIAIIDRDYNESTGSSIRFLADKKCLAICGERGMINIWDLDRNNKETFGKSIINFYYRNNPSNKCGYLTSLEYLKDSQCLVVYSELYETAGIIKEAENKFDDRNKSDLRIFDLDINSKTYLKCIAILNQENKENLTSLAYCNSNKYLVSGDSKGTIKVWNLDKCSETFGNCIAILDKQNGGHTKRITALKYLAGSNALASASQDKTIKIWDLNSKTFSNCTLDENNDGHTKDVCALEYCSDTKFLISSSIDNTIKIWINMKDILGNFNAPNTSTNNAVGDQSGNSICVVC